MSTHPPAPPIHVRPACKADIEATTAIINHYIQHTTANFAEQPVALAQNIAAWETNTLGLGFPYLVAEREGEVLGYAKLSPFRSGTGGGYKITAELSLFVHPERHGEKIGTILLTELLRVVANPGDYATTFIGEARRGEGRIRNVISCMGVDPSAEGGGEALAGYYERFGFERVGRLRGIACKFGKTCVHQGRPGVVAS
jgi:phosphinothricin acetyltransferase